MMWNGIRENSQQKKPLALKDWAFLLQQRSCHVQRKTYPQFHELGELWLIISGQTCMRWNASSLWCFNSSNTVWVLRNDPMHVSDLPHLRPIPSSGSGGTIMDCTGIAQPVHDFTKLKSSWEWDEPPFAFSNFWPLPPSLLLTLPKYHLAGF